MSAQPQASGDSAAGVGRIDSMRTYTVRRVDHEDAGDRRAVLDILRVYLGPMRDERPDERYRWLYLDNPCGVARTYLASAVDGGKPVGITSLFPRTIQVGRDVVVGAIGGDAFVEPAFRRRGIATALHRLARADLDGFGEVGGQAGLALMFGPPELDNLRALVRVGSVVTGAVRTFVRPLTVRGLGERVSQIPFDVARRAAEAVPALLRAPTSDLELEPLGREPDRRVDDVWAIARRAAAIADEVIPVRDAAFYAWRFDRCVSGFQRGYLVLDHGAPIGAVATERRDGKVVVLDVTSAPADFVRIVAAVLHAHRDVDAVSIQIHVPSVRRELALLRLGFVPRETKPFQVQLPETSPHRALAMRKTAWTYTWGDCDVDHVL